MSQQELAINNARITSTLQNYKIEVEKAAAREIAEKLAAVVVKIKSQAGADGRLYGAVTAKDIAEALASSHKITIDKRKIQLDSAIKAFGTYVLDVKLYPEIVGKIHVVISDT